MILIMVNIENNPSFLNSFLDYTATILNKSPNTIKEYNYDLNNFLKFIYNFYLYIFLHYKNPCNFTFCMGFSGLIL